jgi:hypothetical protein
MAAVSYRARRRVVCRIFIKATPQAVWDAICPAVKQAGGYVSPAEDSATIAAILEADPPDRLVTAVDAAGPSSSARSGVVSFELRDTLTGYTALTVSCEPAGAHAAPESGTVSGCDWDRLLGDLKIILEADGRVRQRTVPARSSLRWSGWRLSPV